MVNFALSKLLKNPGSIKGAWKILKHVDSWGEYLVGVLGFSKSVGRLRLRDFSSAFSYRRGTRDLSVMSEVIVHDGYASKKVRRDDVVFDVGGHIGLYSLAVLRRTSGRVVIFEPEPCNLVLLKRNLWGKAIIVTQAVSGRDGKHDLFVCDDQDDTGGHSLFKRTKKSIVVDVLGIQRAFAWYGVPNVLKMDCEGAELDILLAIRPMQFGRIRLIVLEVHEGMREPCLLILERNGYVITEPFHDIIWAERTDEL